MCSSTLVHFPEENRPFSNYGYHAIIETTYGVPTVRCTCSIFIILKGIDHIKVKSSVANMAMFMTPYTWRDYHERRWVD